MNGMETENARSVTASKGIAIGLSPDTLDGIGASAIGHTASTSYRKYKVS